jgi:hypothetical protein
LPKTSVKTSAKTCRIQGCGRYIDAKGLCRPHRLREKEYGDPEAGPQLPPRIGTRVPCKVPGCPNLATATKGLCHAHSMRLKRKGDLDPGSPLHRPRGKAARKAAEAPHYCVIGRDQLEFMLVKLYHDKFKRECENSKPESDKIILVIEPNELEAWRAFQASRPVPVEWTIHVSQEVADRFQELRGQIAGMKEEMKESGVVITLGSSVDVGSPWLGLTRQVLIDAEVLKMPHHGSAHLSKENDTTNPPEGSSSDPE